MKNKNRNKILFAILLILLVNLACGINNEDLLKTAMAETVEVKFTELAIQSQQDSSLENIETETAIPIQGTSAPSIPNPTGTPFPAGTQTSTETVPCNVAQFVTDVTVPDGSDFIPGENFVKTWRLKNVGSCTWNTSYKLTYISGDQMGGPSSQALISNGSVPPNQTVDISVNLISPSNGGNYTGNWKIQNSSNEVFGLTNGNPFYVNIDVVNPTNTPYSPLPLVTIPPIIIVIVPQFTIDYAGMHACSGKTSVSFKIKNTGIYTIQSMQIAVQGPIGDYLSVNTQNFAFDPPPPEPYPQCKDQNPWGGSLAPGEIRWVSTILTSDPNLVQPGRVTLKMCTENNLGGVCNENTIDFNW